MPLLQFEPFSSAVEAPFWHLLSQRKIDLYKLDDRPVDVRGYYRTDHQPPSAENDPATAQSHVPPSRLCLGTNTFDEKKSVFPFAVSVPGKLHNTNTVEEFKNLQKDALFRETAETIWDDIQSGAAFEDPSRLVRFLLITFADLKNFKFYHWFAFPALVLEPPVLVHEVKSISECLTSDQVNDFTSKCHEIDGVPFFLIRASEGGSNVSIGRLVDWNRMQNEGNQEEIFIGFADPCGLPSHPNWSLRNFLVLAKKKWNVRYLKIVCVRYVPARKDFRHSRVLEIDLGDEILSDACPKSVGWEKNAQGKLGPRMADLAPLMDPARLADTAVDLNLKLMRWRLMPSLQLEKISSTKCLLLGAGTLGCHVARCLMGWGVRHITFLDSSRVSFSNPVRQPLYTFKDCLEGGKPKAQCAADRLKEIFPGVISKGYTMSIPMPGHPVAPSSEAQVSKDVELLEQLMAEHDVTFLLMDSRESRWLPTVIGARLGKTVINAALGFDTYVVMRHGIRTSGSSSPAASCSETKEGDDPFYKVPEELGCYFCNDVVAPVDSLRDRTLDQQCTVTRPGLSAIAGATSVELLISLLHHPSGPRAPADLSDSPGSTELGCTPHQIRGFLNGFRNLLLVGRAYEKCTACSDTILQKYGAEGTEFLFRVFNSPSFLEDVTGLTELHRASEEAALDWDAEEEE